MLLMRALCCRPVVFSGNLMKSLSFLINLFILCFLVGILLISEWVIYLTLTYILGIANAEIDRPIDKNIFLELPV